MCIHNGGQDKIRSNSEYSVTSKKASGLLERLKSEEEGLIPEDYLLAQADNLTDYQGL